MYTGPPVVSAECIQHLQGGQWKLVDSLLGGTALNYIGHRACVRKASQMARLSKRSVELSGIFKRKEHIWGQEKNRLHRATINGAWLSDVLRRLNGTELSRE